MYDKEIIERAWDSIREAEYGDKSPEEFQLGLALITLLDMFDNPEEYPDNVMAFVLDNADAWAEYARAKYDKEIRELENEDVGSAGDREQELD